MADPDVAVPATRVTAIVPVKRLTAAKSRLALPHEVRRELVLAFAADTVRAVLGSPLVADVVLVTADPAVTERVRRLGVRHVSDLGSGLDDAISLGVHAAAGTRASSGGVLIVPADLPCLRPQDVTRVLAGAPPAAPAFVPDRSGRGTTMVVLPPGMDLVTRYGPGSAARHRALGFEPLTHAPVRARQDVDTLHDLERALDLGVGPGTRAVLGARQLV